jgi:putative zinc finger/helix-turn-helix YgiT family protein
MGEPVEYQARVRRCSVCKGEYAPTALEEENFRSAYDIYRRRHNLLFPEQIRATREKYGLSQRNFSRFLGWGDITVHRYEAGALPDTAYNVMLVLVDDPLNALKVFMLNRSNLAPGIAEKLKKRIQELVRNNSCAPSYGNDVCAAADELSAISVRESEVGRYTVAEVFPEYIGKETQVALRAYRTREGFTQKQLAELTAIPQHHISEMENGNRSIGKEQAKKLAAALHCDYRQLL